MDFEVARDNDIDFNLRPKIKCRYVDCSEFKNIYSKKNGISIIHLNICSLAKHIDTFHDLLKQLGTKFAILAISETRIIIAPQ